MKTFNDGGPAFPVTTDHGSVYALPGMTLRDYFAAKALQGMLADKSSGYPHREYACDAYSLADAMLAERKQPMEDQS